MIWTVQPDIGGFETYRKDTMLELLDMRLTDVTDESLSASMPVDQRTIQPYGILHGGASATLAETLGSLASQYVVDDPANQKVVGIALNINHLRQVTSGHIHGKAHPVKLGRRLHIWRITIHDDDQRQVSEARLTVMVL
jgi:1,4-dihydroxy-2-naphthoyl-CoA hydrolase